MVEQRLRQLSARLRQDPALDRVPFAHALIDVVTAPTGISSKGYPYLAQEAWERFRDTVPHLLAVGGLVLDSLEQLKRSAQPALQSDECADARESFDNACVVVRRVVQTAAVTAPPDLWLLRHVVGTLKALGVTQPLLNGSQLEFRETDVWLDGAPLPLDINELYVDCAFLLARGYLVEESSVLRMSSHQRARRVFEEIPAAPAGLAPGISNLWADLFSGKRLTGDQLDVLDEFAKCPSLRDETKDDIWYASVEEIEIGHRLLPLVLGLRVSGHSARLASGEALVPAAMSSAHPELAAKALQLLEHFGMLCHTGEGAVQASAIGQRVFDRGPGPFGIIEAYHPYMTHLRTILTEGRRSCWVSRGANVAASQVANRKTFRMANDALDAFCAETGFRYSVFIEHAIGKGEATRQRFERSGDEEIHYFGADLEDAAIEAAEAEREAGHLPANLRFIRSADIGRPDRVVETLQQQGIDTQGAVMICGNGFHEVREQTDAKMIDVFRGYQKAGIILIFTEESALSVGDLLETAWNTYHAGFKYVHERSGQGLRPAETSPAPRVGRPLRASWNECATRAGYLRLNEKTTRTRTIYPCTPSGGRNPAISVTHFFVPQALAHLVST